MDVKDLRRHTRICVNWLETWIQRGGGGGSVLLDLKLTLKKKQGREKLHDKYCQLLPGGNDWIVCAV